MAEWRLFPEGTVPECTTPAWYARRDRAPHVEQPEHRDRLDLAAGLVLGAAAEYGCRSLVDLGAGDGGLLSLVISRNPYLRAWGYDLQDSNVLPAVAERRMDVRYADVVNDQIEWGDIAVATEILEHLVDPHGFVRRIGEMGSRILVASSPRNENDQQHYEHHVWAWDEAGYRALLEQGGWAVMAHATTGPFQVIMGVRA